MTQDWKESRWHNKLPSTWNLQTENYRQKLFQDCSNSKAPVTGAVEFMGILQCNSDTLPQWSQIWYGAPSFLPHHFPFEKWLQKHHFATQALQLGCCPFIHKWHWPHKGHKLLFIKRAPGYMPFLELREFSLFLGWPKNTLSHLINPEDPARPKASWNCFEELLSQASWEDKAR